MPNAVIAIVNIKLSNWLILSTRVMGKKLNELTRTTQGTGIGLALVNDLISVQQGDIKVKRQTPGLSMILSFQCKRMSSVTQK